MNRRRILAFVLAISGLLVLGTGPALAARDGRLGGIEVTPKALNMGNIPASACPTDPECTYPIYVTNTATAPMTVSDFHITGDGFYLTGLLYPDQCYSMGELSPGASCVITVGFCTTVACTFGPLAEGRYQGVLSASWTDGTRVIQMSVKLSAKIVAG
jgi:hypothetical protein